MVATRIKKITSSILRVASVYLRDIANTFSPVLHLNVSREHLLFWLFACNDTIEDLIEYKQLTCNQSEQKLGKCFIACCHLSPLLAYQNLL